MSHHVRDVAVSAVMHFFDGDAHVAMKKKRLAQFCNTPTIGLCRFAA
jgi:hypothetical protein